MREREHVYAKLRCKIPLHERKNIGNVVCVCVCCICYGKLNYHSMWKITCIKLVAIWQCVPGANCLHNTDFRFELLCTSHSIYFIIIRSSVRYVNYFRVTFHLNRKLMHIRQNTWFYIFVCMRANEPISIRQNIFIRSCDVCFYSWTTD